MNIGVIMAGGKGKRFGAEGKNKTAELFNGKPIVKYGVELFEKTTDKIIVVLGVAPQSVTEAIGRNEMVDYAFQLEPLGTGDALRVAMEQIISLGLEPEMVFVGNGDHMMFYDPQVIEDLKDLRKDTGAAVCLISIMYPQDPDKFVWGRIVRNAKGEVERIVEQKDATPEERKIAELNVNFYGIDYQFAKKYFSQIQPSKVTGEYYITEMVELAKKNGYKVEALVTPFEQVGIGINTREELKESEELFNRQSPNLIR